MVWQRDKVVVFIVCTSNVVFCLEMTVACSSNSLKYNIPVYYGAKNYSKVILNFLT